MTDQQTPEHLLAAIRELAAKRPEGDPLRVAVEEALAPQEFCDAQAGTYDYGYGSHITQADRDAYCARWRGVLRWAYKNLPTDDGVTFPKWWQMAEVLREAIDSDDEDKVQATLAAVLTIMRAVKEESDE